MVVRDKWETNKSINPCCIESYEEVLDLLIYEHENNPCGGSHVYNYRRQLKRLIAKVHAMITGEVDYEASADYRKERWEELLCLQKKSTML